MPGLLQTPDHKLRSIKVLYAVLAEFIGVAIFSFYGSATSLLVYITANISGGQMNPAVTLSTLMTGHTSLSKTVLYIVAQIAGGILGSLLLTGLLTPNVTLFVTPKIGTSELPAGCFGKSHLTGIQLFGWEALMTFVLVSTVYAVAVGEPHFGIMGPLVVGMALFVAVEAGGQYTGGGLNPARVLGPACVFGCNWDTAWIYIVGELFGGLVAGAFSVPLYGKGKDFGRLFDHVHMPHRHRGRRVHRGKRGGAVNGSIVSVAELDPVTRDTTGSFANDFPAGRVIVVHEAARSPDEKSERSIGDGQTGDYMV